MPEMCVKILSHPRHGFIRTDGGNNQIKVLFGFIQSSQCRNTHGNLLWKTTVATATVCCRRSNDPDA